MKPWEIVLLVVAATIAVSSLTRLMLARRDLLVGQVKGQLKRKQKRPKKEKDEAA